AYAKERRKGYACFANVHMIIEAYQDKQFDKDVNSATLVLPDGMPLVKTLKWFYGIEQDRVAGMDVMPDLIRIASNNNLKLFFFGTTPELLEKIRLKIEKDFPKTDVVGLFSPPFNEPLNNDLYTEMINSSGANLVFVALGCPKQEKWMAQNSSKINAMLLGVGGAFPVFAGVASRAPLFMQNAGLEWVYRLYQEPKRLFKRYLFTNSIFLFLVLKAKIKLIFQT
ncbi:MAG TPA: WecB/TagA/CpsF family glycosyltransferase, partial [Bacteroidia bacterium]|nr:WecB/TagA/CpsF family glycosyltransferase [Bacteroidia bacterium]